MAEDHASEAVFAIAQHALERAARAIENSRGSLRFSRAVEIRGNFQRSLARPLRAFFVARCPAPGSRAGSFEFRRFFDPQRPENSRHDFRQFRPLSG